MAKTTSKITSVDTLMVDLKTNVRLHNNYNVPGMKQSILDLGRITDPIHARLCDSVVLRGNHRALAGQELLADPNTPQEVAAGLKKIQVVYHDVTPGSAEELEIICDHGRQKGLCKTEVLQTVWRMDKQFLSEGQIGQLFYSALAIYTGNAKKAMEAQAMTNLRERGEYLKKWLHGTLGNYMLAAAKMGEYVREQMIKTHLSDDRLLPAGDKVELRCSRDRISALSAAKTKDSPKEGGEGWTVENGGINFNALLEKFRAEDRGEDSGEEKVKRPSVKELTARADVFKSKAIRSALLVAAGDKGQGRELVEMDDQLHRTSMVFETIAKRLPEIKDVNLAALLKAIVGLDNSPAGEVEFCINRIVEQQAK
jgi:hypothetical protein